MTKLMDVDLIEEIQGKYGEVIAQAILDHLDRGNIKDRDLQCMEVLQMSEIACRFRSAVRTKIEEYRNLEVEERMLEAKLEHIKAEKKAMKADISERNNLYRQALSEFWYMYKCYMEKSSENVKTSKAVVSKIVDYGKARDFQTKLLDKYVVASNAFKPCVESNKASSAA